MSIAVPVMCLVLNHVSLVYAVNSPVPKFPESYFVADPCYLPDTIVIFCHPLTS